MAFYPSVFAPDSIWSVHRYLLPNLAVALLQTLTLLLVFFFLRETHPQLTERRDLGLSATKMVRNYLKRDHVQRGVYALLPADHVFTQPPRSTDDSQAHQLDDLEEGQHTQEREATPAHSRTFTSQVVLQILALSLLAFHKVSSDALTGTFLSLGPPASHDGSNTVGTRSQTPPFPHANRGFGLDTRSIGTIFLTEAIFRVAIQPTAIPWFISKLGTLRAFRCVLGLYPATYLATPFLPTLPPPVGLVVLLLDLWTKVALSSVGYICSAVLYVTRGTTHKLVGRHWSVARMKELTPHLCGFVGSQTPRPRERRWLESMALRRRSAVLRGLWARS